LDGQHDVVVQPANADERQDNDSRQYVEPIRLNDDDIVATSQPRTFQPSALTRFQKMR
jgi:hypothetical protein